ncbi:MAG: DUF4149 domain-containing protein [Terracidiphilus sp.]|jgi:hypothetical protein
MKVLLRTLLSLALIVWLGAEIFFPIVAAVTFHLLHPDTHTAGRIVGELLRTMHFMGLASGSLALFVLTPLWGLYKPRATAAPMFLLAAMIGLTLYSQLAIIPAMDRDRTAVGGTIDAVDAANPNRIDFEKLHRWSVDVEGTILLLGLATVVLIAKAETRKSQE